MSYNIQPKVIFLTSGPSQKKSLKEYIETKFKKQAKHFGFTSAHNRTGCMDLISKYKKGQLVFIPHMSSKKQLGAHELAQKINSRNSKAVVVAWTSNPPEKMDLTTLVGVIVRRRNATKKMYAEISEVISNFLAEPVRWVVSKAVRQLQENRRTKLQGA